MELHRSEPLFLAFERWSDTLDYHRDRVAVWGIPRAPINISMGSLYCEWLDLGQCTLNRRRKFTCKNEIARSNERFLVVGGWGGGW